MLTDSCWDTLSALMRHFGLTCHKVEHRLTLEGLLYRMRTGIPWRDLPPEFGRWNTVFVRFNAWSKNGILQMIFKWLSGISDREWLFIDGSIIRAHQHSAGAATDKDEAIGKSRGGRSTKIHLAVDSQGLPVHFELSRGQTHDIKHAESLVNHSPVSDFVIADKGYDSETVRNIIKQKGATPVIPYRKNSRKSDQRLDKG